MKALALLYESDTALKDALDKAFTESGDPDLLRFVHLLQSRRRPGGLGASLISLGEIVLASFLTVIGIVAFIPTLIGLVMPQQFLDYFSRRGAGPRLQPPLRRGPRSGLRPRIGPHAVRV